ncbi:PTS sugar transporter subunit IIB [bacterium]|nr:PTS sugar transporter subunit IIB [bacterium]MBU1985565.1 PTS sugar transporter subunit IIB [bacterium]
MNLPLLSKKDKLLFPIVRVDDRLLHGQVVVGWGQTLGLKPVLLASDRVSKDPALCTTYRGLIPEELCGDVRSLSDVAEQWIRGDFKGTRAMVVVESPVDALKLVKLGVPLKSLTLGGLHYREGREELLPYLFLSDWERTTLTELKKHGVKIVCQDLPVAKPIPYEE